MRKIYIGLVIGALCFAVAGNADAHNFQRASIGRSGYQASMPVYVGVLSARALSPAVYYLPAAPYRPNISFYYRNSLYDHGLSVRGFCRDWQAKPSCLNHYLTHA